MKSENFSVENAIRRWFEAIEAKDYHDAIVLLAEGIANCARRADFQNAKHLTAMLETTYGYINGESGMAPDSTVVLCSFCGTRENETTHFIAGPQVYICSDCVKLSVEILKSGTAPN
jgi:hypothetical protein